MVNQEHSSKSKNEKKDGMDLDELLPLVGEFGHYQKLLLWLVCLPACVPCGFCAFNQLFMSGSPEHWCRTPLLEANISDPKLRRALSIPPLKNRNSSSESCLRYAVNWTEIIESLSTFAYFKPNESWNVEPCYDGWEYDTTEVQSSIVIDFDLVCGKEIYPTLGLVGLNLGSLFGVYMFGIINDRFGRRLSFFICLMFAILGNILSAFSSDFWIWTVTRIIVGMSVPAVYQIPFIISLELVGPNYRSFVTVMTCIFYTIGLMMLAGITYMVRNWRHLALFTSVPFLLYYIYWWFLPESPRWLLARGRLEEALKILETLSRVNNQALPTSFRQKIKQKMMLHRTLSEEKKLKKGHGMAVLFKTPNMRLKTLLITLNWFANETVYVGLNYYGPVLGKDPYLSFLLSSVVEIPSYFLGWVLMDYWGRRWPLALCMIVSGIFCTITVLLPSDAVNLILTVFLISKFAISISFLIIYPFAGELFPTEVRGLGIGTSAYIAGVGLIVIPFITYLGSEALVLPLAILGALSVIGGISSLRLPETLHHKLPQTMEEGEEFGKDWSISECCRCIPLRPNYQNRSSYEDLDKIAGIEMLPTEMTSETIPNSKRTTIPKLLRQSSVMETPLDSMGSMKMTYWF